MNRGSRVAAFVLAVVAAAACDRIRSNDDDEDGGQRPLVAGFNAIADMHEITFLREEQPWSALEYGEATAYQDVGPDQYDLNFDAILPGDEATVCDGDDGDDLKDDDECSRLVAQSINAVADHEYVVALLGRYGALRVQVYDKLIHEFDTTTADGDPDDETTEVQFFQFSDGLPEMDVYLERPGSNLSAVQSRATLTAGGEFHAIVPKGEYVITLSPVGNPASPYYTSETFALQEQASVGFAILAGAGDGTSTIKVARFRDQSGVLLDRRVRTELRVANVSLDAGSLDFYAEDSYAQPFVAAVAKDTASPYVTVPSGALTDFDLDATPAGNPDVLLAREQIDLARGERSTFAIFGTVGRLDGIRLQDSGRRIATHAQMRMANTAGGGLDFFVVRTGSNINTLDPTINLGSGVDSGTLFFEPERYDILLTRAGTDDVVFGPETVELAGGGLYTVIATGTSDLASADAVLLDDFVN